MSRIGRVGRRLARGLVRLASAAVRAWPIRSPGELDLPATLPANEVTIYGWTLDARLDTLAIVITLDGEPVTVETTAMTRPDLERPRWTRRRRAAFMADIDLSDLADRVVRIGALVVREHGIVDQLDEREVRVEPRLVATLTSGGEAVVVRGILRGPSPAARVEVLLDGAPVVLARPWRETPTGRPEPHAVVEGVDALCPLEDHGAGVRAGVAVEVRARRLDGSEERLGPVAIDAPTRAAEIPGEVARLRDRLTPSAVPARSPATGGHRLLVVTHSLSIGGAQLYVDELLRGLLATHDVSCLVVAADDGPLRAPLETRGATVEVCGPFPGRLLAYERRLLEIAEVVQAFEPDVALVNTMSAAIGADLCRRLGVPYHWAIHESLPPAMFWSEAYGGGGYHPEVRARGLDALRDAERLVFEADSTLDLYRAVAPADRLTKVPYGIDVRAVDRHRAEARRDALRAELGFSDDDLLFVCIGTMEPRKLQTGLVLAFDALGRTQRRARLVLVGDLPDRPYSRAVHELIERLGLGSRVHLLPVTPHIHDWYVRSDVIVSTSDLESMPRSLMEAMAFERVVLSTDVFGVRELIEDGKTGFLMAPRDLEATVEGFERVLALSPEERAAIGRDAAAVIRERHDASAYVRAFRELLLPPTT